MDTDNFYIEEPATKNNSGLLVNETIQFILYLGGAHTVIVSRYHFYIIAMYDMLYKNILYNLYDILFLHNNWRHVRTPFTKICFAYINYYILRLSDITLNQYWNIILYSITGKHIIKDFIAPQALI